MTAVETKFCRRCEQDKPISAFGARCDRPGGLQSECLACKRARSKQWRAENPVKVAESAKDYRARHRKWFEEYDRAYWAANKSRLTADARRRKYGISTDEFNALLHEQNNACAVCRLPFSDEPRAAFVDHCHVSGAVRGLLCTRCNSGIAFLGDSIEGLEAALEYIKKARAHAPT